MTESRSIAPATGRLGLLMPGMGAVASTLIAGVMHSRKTGDDPIGSVSQMAHIRLGKREESRNPLIKEFVPLADLDDIVFGGWDPLSPNMLEAAQTAGVMTPEDLAPLSGELEGVVAMDAVFDQRWVSRIEGVRVKTQTNKMEQAQALIEDIERFRTENDCDRLVMVWCASTEAYQEASAVHDTVESFEQGMRDDDDNISPSQIYAYAALMSDVPFANGAPNLTVDLPCIVELSERRGVPIAGKDFKTGQTLMKTLISPGLKARMLGVRGWYSTNILGNRDGEVLDAPENFQTKETSKLGVLDTILQPSVYPNLYGDIEHKVRIDYYPPRGDDKEGWDNIDIFGWLGYPMQIKINFLCRDSILAAPIVLDLALFMDLAARAGESGVQEWLSFYFKAPQAGPAGPEHDIFIQQTKLKNTLREWMGEEPVTHSEAG
ncbi:MAG: inositol-3-phosphate synthase [Actinomycetota bacterium]